jgi:hypothetical protein
MQWSEPTRLATKTVNNRPVIGDARGVLGFRRATAIAEGKRGKGEKEIRASAPLPLCPFSPFHERWGAVPDSRFQTLNSLPTSFN